MYRVDHKIMNDTIFFLEKKTRYKHLKYAVEFNAFHELIRLGKKITIHSILLILRSLLKSNPK